MLGERSNGSSCSGWWGGRGLVRVVAGGFVCLVVVAAGSGVSLSAERSRVGSHAVVRSHRRMPHRLSARRRVVSRLAREERVRAARRRRWLESPRAREQRLVSETAFHGLAPTSAQRLLLSDYKSVLVGVSANPASSLARSGSVVRYLGDRSAIVRTGAGLEVETSTAPLRVAHGGSSEAPVNLQLQRTGGLFVPINPLQPVSISRKLSGGVVVGASGLRLTANGAEATGSLIGHEDVFFGNVGVDTDATVAPTLYGAEFFTILRSRLSPETLSYRVVLPQGASLQASSVGATVVRAGETLARVMDPSARDAQGTSVPVKMSVVGDELVLHIPHRHLDVAYPILVDPEVVASIKTSAAHWEYFSEAREGRVYYSWPDATFEEEKEKKIEEEEEEHGGYERFKVVSSPFVTTSPGSSGPISITLPEGEFPSPHYGESARAEFKWVPPAELGEVTSVEFSGITVALSDSEFPANHEPHAVEANIEACTTGGEWADPSRAESNQNNGTRL